MTHPKENTLDITSLQLHRIIGRSCHQHAGAVAVSDLHTRYTYGQLWGEAMHIASLLQEAGLQPGEPVIITINNECFDMAAFIAVWQAGGTAVPVHQQAGAATWQKLVSLTTARYVLLPDGRATSYNDSLQLIRGCLYRTAITEYIPDPLLEDAALIVFTSGTTGLPKGVVQGHSQYARKLYSLAAVIRPPDGIVTLQYLQLSFSFGQWTSFLTLALGGHLVLRPKFTATGFRNDLVQLTELDWAPVVPSMLRLLFADTEQVAHHPLLQYLLVGGEVMPAALGEKIRSCWPDTGIIDIYGLTETNSGDFILRAEEYDRHKGTIGMPAPGIAFRIADGDRILRCGETGELEVATTFRMKGYLRNPELTAAIMHGDYLKTGDTGWMDEQGMVHLKGRKSEQINVGGRKVSPLEIENVYLAHEGIQACLAGAMDDEMLGERPALLVIPAGDAVLAEEQLKQWGRQQLEHYKVPALFRFVQEFPAGSTGKADRSKIRSLLNS